MKSLLHRIEIRNFKAFREFELNLEGRHLLIYGPNGSGKSSLYWALYTFLQSARKSKPDVEKYFDPANQQHLLNIHEQGSAIPKPGEIALTLRDTGTKIDTIYRISQSVHSTFRQSAILKGDLASDFITYRFFFGFSHFRNSEKFDLWPLFEKEILPFCVSTGGKMPLDSWDAIKSGDPNPYGSRGLGGTYAYDGFTRKVNEFATILPGIVDSISTEAQRFYDMHFSANDPAKVSLKLGVTTPPSAFGSNQNDFKFTKPVIEFGVQIDGKTIHRPQTFLNEAKLTQLALSVRFAASLVNLHQSDLKLLVLDDLLVSLDMSNRMKVVEILLSQQFANYQKIILTHDLGFFREFHRVIADNHSEWCFKKLQGNSKDGITIKEEKSPIEKAEDYLNNHDLEEAAACLRKAAEDSAQKFRKVALREIIPPGEFHSLTENLRAARNGLSKKLPLGIFERVLAGVPEEHRNKLVRLNDDDIDGDPTLDAGTKGKLKCQRRELSKSLNDLDLQHLRTIKIVDDILKMTGRVLNPAAHWGEPALYDAEVRKALMLIKQFEKSIKP